MQLKIFWNKAIEYYCTYKRSDSKEGFDTVFIAIAEESLGQIKEKFIKYSGLDEQEIKLVEGNISKVGGIIDSYYSAVKEVHNEQGNPAQFSFLRFSILVVGAFKQDDSPLRNYWIDFDPFLVSRNIPVIINRTDYLKKIEINLTKWCKTQHNKTFFNLNVFGDNHDLVNVGKIKAHSIFQGRTLENIKKSIYNLGYSDSHNIEDLNYEDVELIIKESGLTRIISLFNRDNDAKEVVFECLKIWMKNWIPNQEEKVRLLIGKSSSKKAPLSIHRLWEIRPEESNPSIKIKFGFIYKSTIGDGGIYYLNKNENIYIDTSWPIKLSGDRILYEIINYQCKSELNENDLALCFKMIEPEILESNYVLEKVPKQPLFIEQLKKKIIIKENPYLIACKDEICSNKLKFFFKVGLKGKPEVVFNLLRIIDSFDYKNISFIVTNNINISIVGLPDGRKGVKSFQSFCPIILKISIATKGVVQLFTNDDFIISYDLSSLTNILDTEINFGLLEKGKYSIRYLLNDKYIYFENGQNSIDFEIVDSREGDRREPGKIGVEFFQYHEFRRLKEFNSLESNVVIFPNNERELIFKDQYFDLYIVKDGNGFWVDISDTRNNQLRRSLAKPEFFLQRTLFKPENFKPKFSKWKKSLVYLDTNFSQYKYSFEFCETPIEIELSFNTEEFFIRNDDCKILNNFIKGYFYYYKIIEMDDDLMKKYPNVFIGDEVYVLSNKLETRTPERLIKYINQEFFPFKK